ncbi:MAG: radical SAM protein [Chthonomonadales bacterium]
MRIKLINAPLVSTVCDRTTGHQIPLGLMMLGGPLIDAGYDVELIDGAVHHMGVEEIVNGCRGADVVLISHVGSTQAHPSCMSVLRAIKKQMPRVLTVYGGVHPTYHFKEIMAQSCEVDIIVRGEGETTIIELAAAIRQGLQAATSEIPMLDLDLSAVKGVVWRRSTTNDSSDRSKIVVNPNRELIPDIGVNRVGWELVSDWNAYQAFGWGKAAVVQFSRGCPHTCSYCGQWMFWKKWRYRDPVAFVDEIEWLHRTHGIRFFWIADENPTTDKALWKQALEEIGRRNLDIGLSASIRTQDIVRDADILPIYKRAGFVYILLGVETVTDEVMVRIRKNSSVDDAFEAIRLLRENDIVSVVDYMVGLEDETLRSLWRSCKGLLKYDGDLLNILYLTPHAWTPLGNATKSAPVMEPDMWKWDYRHQVLSTKTLSPTTLFLCVKVLEAFYHVHPRRLSRILFARDRVLRTQLRWTLLHTVGWFWFEIWELFVDRFVKQKYRNIRRESGEIMTRGRVQTAAAGSQPPPG